MKSSTLITILSTFLLVGCSKQQSTLDKQLDEVEKIIEVNPDSASSILENIASPEQPVSYTHLTLPTILLV